jgi:hypothetical protein
MIIHIIFQKTDIKEIPVEAIENERSDDNCDPDEEGFSPDLNFVFHSSEL